jgi:hypothetical protein
LELWQEGPKKDYHYYYYAKVDNFVSFLLLIITLFGFIILRGRFPNFLNKGFDSFKELYNKVPDELIEVNIPIF